MGGLFGGPKLPAVQPAPPSPLDDSAAQRERDEAAAEQRRRRTAGGRASTILTSPLGVTESAEPSVARKYLLGQ